MQRREEGWMLSFSFTLKTFPASRAGRRAGELDAPVRARGNEHGGGTMNTCNLVEAVLYKMCSWVFLFRLCGFDLSQGTFLFLNCSEQMNHWLIIIIFIF